MNRIQRFILSIIILMLIGCAKEEEDSIIPGYIKPGEFRPKGMLAEKYYNFNDTSIIDPADSSCGPSEQCLAVYSNWLLSEAPLDGIAIRNSDTPNLKLSMKIFRLKGGRWKISLIYNGIGYTNQDSILSDDITVSLCKTTTETLPPYTPPSSDPLDGSGIYLTRATVEFQKNIPLIDGDDPPNTITIQPGDQIVAHAYNTVTSVACP